MKIGFEKVSFERFKQDCLKSNIVELAIIPDEELKTIYDNIKLPKRGTTGAAGYDFSTPFNFTLSEDNPIVMIPTGIRIVMPKDRCLILMPRSGLGFKTGMGLSNTLGLIDSDYQFSDNEGHIMAKLERGFNDLSLNRGDRFMQGVILRYDIVDNDDCEEVRKGGFGSTGVK